MMNWRIKSQLRLAALLLAVLAPSVALAQTFPTKPLRLICPFAPGGTTDVVARVVADGTREAHRATGRSREFEVAPAEMWERNLSHARRLMDTHFYSCLPAIS